MSKWRMWDSAWAGAVVCVVGLALTYWASSLTEGACRRLSVNSTRTLVGGACNYYKCIPCMKVKPECSGYQCKDQEELCKTEGWLYERASSNLKEKCKTAEEGNVGKCSDWGEWPCIVTGRTCECRDATPPDEGRVCVAIHWVYGKKSQYLRQPCWGG